MAEYKAIARYMRRAQYPHAVLTPRRGIRIIGVVNVADIPQAKTRIKRSIRRTVIRIRKQRNSEVSACPIFRQAKTSYRRDIRVIGDIKRGV